MPPTTKTSTMSSGAHKLSKIKRQISRLKMKINRWTRYVEEINNNKRKGSVKRWDTAGLKKHLELLETLV